MKDESSESLAVSQLGQATQRDHAINAIKAALEAVPMVGGTLASLVSDYIPQQQERRLIQFVQALSKDLSAVAERLDHDYIRSEQFTFLFEGSCRAATRKYSEETLRALSSYRAVSMATRPNRAIETDAFAAALIANVRLLWLHWPQNWE